MDLYHLSQKKYQYFQRLAPMAKVGASIFVYRIASDDANRTRRELGLPGLDDREAVNSRAGNGLLYRTFVDSRGTQAHYCSSCLRSTGAIGPGP